MENVKEIINKMNEKELKSFLIALASNNEAIRNSLLSYKEGISSDDYKFRIAM